MFNERIFPCNGQINVVIYTVYQQSKKIICFPFVLRPEESRHSFRTKTFRKDRVCDVCRCPSITREIPAK
ncbi:hypothetical protein TNCT_191491, partial [Trichonephila clavata]